MNEDEKNLRDMLEKLDGLEDEAEREHYRSLLTDWHKRNENSERSHGRKRDARALDSTENSAASEKDRRGPPPDSTLYRYDEWEDILFSDSPDDLHELVTDGALSRIIQRLTHCQKEVLGLLAVHGYTTAEAAELLGVSERNVHKLYATALYHIRGKIYPIIKFRRKLETDERYRELARKRGIYATRAEKEFMDKADGTIRGYYGEMTGKQEKPPGV